MTLGSLALWPLFLMLLVSSHSDSNVKCSQITSLMHRNIAIVEGLWNWAHCMKIKRIWIYNESFSKHMCATMFMQSLQTYMHTVVKIFMTKEILESFADVHQGLGSIYSCLIFGVAGAIAYHQEIDYYKCHQEGDPSERWPLCQNMNILQWSSCWLTTWGIAWRRRRRRKDSLGVTTASAGIWCTLTLGCLSRSSWIITYVPGLCYRDSKPLGYIKNKTKL